MSQQARLFKQNIYIIKTFKNEVTMKMSANPVQACLDTLVSPEMAFNTVKDKKGWSWLPFVLMISTTIAVFVYYFNAVDFTWLRESMLNALASSGDMSDEEIKATGEFYKKDTMMWSTVIGGSVGTIVINLIYAAYLNITTKVSAQSEYKFTDWFAFTWWVALPAFVSMLLAALVVFFSSDGAISLQDLQPTSLNSLIFSVEASNAWFNFLEGITLFTFWGMAVATIGLNAWLKIDISKALKIAIAPFVVIYSLWAVYIAFIA